MKILAIETSCDETAAAVVEDGRQLLSNVVATQIEIHRRFGGVFPEVASRQHVLAIDPVVRQALAQAGVASPRALDAVAVTQGPGLAGSLLVGVNAAKGLAFTAGLPLLGVNHLEGHIYSNWLRTGAGFGDSARAAAEDIFPTLVLIVSGGHTEILCMTGHGRYERMGGTLDDAAGEAFDKVARILGLPYPGGPSIQKSAAEGNPRAFNFPRARMEGSWDFSFSGLKTAVLRTVKGLEEEHKPLPVADLAASFQAAVVDVLFQKTLKAAEHFKVKEILIGGGVSANRALREAFLGQETYKVHIPPLSLCTDNAAMIAAAGYYRFALGQRDPLDLDILPNWPLS